MPFGKPRTLLALGLIAGVLSGARPACACSCAMPEVRKQLEEADGAFAGVLLNRSDGGPGESFGDVTFVFKVERSVKGNFGDKVEVISSGSSASCALEVSVGQRVGLVLYRSDGVWRSNLCSQMDADELIKAGGSAQPGPSPEHSPGGPVEPTLIASPAPTAEPQATPVAQKPSDDSVGVLGVAATIGGLVVIIAIVLLAAMTLRRHRREGQ